MDAAPSQKLQRHVAPDFKVNAALVLCSEFLNSSPVWQRRQLIFDSFARIRQVLSRAGVDDSEDSKVIGGARGAAALRLRKAELSIDVQALFCTLGALATTASSACKPTARNAAWSPP